MRLLLTFLIVLAVTLTLAGCGNVYLKGEANIAAETSAMDAYNAVNRATTQPASGWTERAYLTENFLQWRDLVRAARKDAAWGPKLEGE